MSIIDKANGFMYSGLAGRSPYPPECQYAENVSHAADLWRAFQDTYVEGEVIEKNGEDE